MNKIYFLRYKKHTEKVIHEFDVLPVENQCFRLVIENVILKTRFVKEQEAKELLCSLGSNFF